MERSNYKLLKRTNNSWLLFVALTILANHYSPLSKALAPRTFKDRNEHKSISEVL